MRSGQVLLTLAAIAVAFAAADTYVVVLALPEMMASVGIPLDELQRAAPIVSGFLLGYIAMLPLIGRLSDLRGRVPVLVASLIVFAVGSLVTGLAYDLTSMISGRFLKAWGLAGWCRPRWLSWPISIRQNGAAYPWGLCRACKRLGAS